MRINNKRWLIPLAACMVMLFGIRTSHAQGLSASTAYDRFISQLRDNLLQAGKPDPDTHCYHFVLLLSTGHMENPEWLAAKNIATEMVDEYFAPGDMVSIATFQQGFNSEIWGARFDSDMSSQLKTSIPMSVQQLKGTYLETALDGAVQKANAGQGTPGIGDTVFVTLTEEAATTGTDQADPILKDPNFGHRMEAASIKWTNPADISIPIVDRQDPTKQNIGNLHCYVYLSATPYQDYGVPPSGSRESYHSPPPPAPSNLTAAVSESTGAVGLSWKESVTGVRFHIKRSSSGRPATIATTNDPKYTDSSATDGKSYTYSISAFNSDGKESPDSVATTITLPSNTGTWIAIVVLIVAVVLLAIFFSRFSKPHRLKLAPAKPLEVSIGAPIGELATGSRQYDVRRKNVYIVAIHLPGNQYDYVFSETLSHNSVASVTVKGLESVVLRGENDFTVRNNERAISKNDQLIQLKASNGDEHEFRIERFQ